MPYMEGALWKWTNYVSGEYIKSLHAERPNSGFKKVVDCLSVTHKL